MTMALQPRTPFKVFLRVQESPDEDLSVDAAFAKQPDAVRDALLEAIRLVPLRSTDITLLRIENTFLSALKRPWKEPHGLRLVLESCRQGKIENRTERLFLKHGKEYGIVVLGVGTKQDDHRLFRDIDPLPEEDLIRLIENVQRFPKKASITAFLEEFAQSPLGMSFSLNVFSATEHKQKMLSRIYLTNSEGLEAEEKVFNYLL
jgi:hypothetical protein